jgi:hypothetical protein
MDDQRQPEVQGYRSQAPFVAPTSGAIEMSANIRTTMPAATRAIITLNRITVPQKSTGSRISGQVMQ